MILPGFGNLEVKESSGEAPEAGKRIDPPGVNIFFDSNFSKDDGLLASSLAEDEGLDPEEASQQVLELVDNIKFSLDKGVPSPVAGVGTFNRDNEGKVSFTPDKEWILEPDQYGLEPMDIPELEELKKEKREAPVKKEDRVVIPVKQKGPVKQSPEKPAESVEEKETAKPAKPVEAKPEKAVVHAPPSPPPPVQEPQKRERAHRKTRMWRIIWAVVALLIVVLLVVLFVPAEYLDIINPVEREATEAEATDPSATDEPADVREEPVAGTGETGGDETQPIDSYFLIAGSFKHLGYASELEDQLKAMGYETDVMVTEIRMYRVSVGGYATKEEALKSLEGIRSTPGLESCWLLSNE